MEIDMLLDGTWYLFDMYVGSYSPDKSFCLNVCHEKSGWDYSITVKLSDVATDTRLFDTSGNIECMVELCEAFESKHWELLKDIVLTLNACDSYQDAKKLIEKVTATC